MRFRLSDAGTGHSALLASLIIPLVFLLTLNSAYGLNYTVTISIVTGPKEAGAAIIIDNIYHHDGEVVRLPAGLHNIKAYSPSAWNFKGWIATLNLEIGNYTRPSTTLTVNGNGTLGADWVVQGNAPNGRVSVDPNNVAVRPGVTTPFEVLLENYSNATEVFHPFFQSGIFGYVSGENVTIDFGQSKTVIINATVPSDAKPGSYTATLLAVIYYKGNLSYSTNRYTSVKVTVVPPLSSTTQTNTTTTTTPPPPPPDWLYWLVLVLIIVVAIIVFAVVRRTPTAPPPSPPAAKPELNEARIYLIMLAFDKYLEELPKEGRLLAGIFNRNQLWLQEKKEVKREHRDTKWSHGTYYTNIDNERDRLVKDGWFRVVEPNEDTGRTTYQIIIDNPNLSLVIPDYKEKLAEAEKTGQS